MTAVRVERGNAADIGYATGAIEPVRWARVTPLVKGRIVERCRCEGKEVNPATCSRGSTTRKRRQR